MKKYTVIIERTDEEDMGTTERGDLVAGVTQLHRELQAAFTNGEIAGTFQILPEESSSQGSVNVPADQLRAFFADLRETAADSLRLLTILGIPSNAAIVKKWRGYVYCDASLESIDKSLEEKVKQLTSAMDALDKLYDAASSVRAAQEEIGNALLDADRHLSRIAR